jgi:ribA/ribD-fused uncharacterized protein
VAIERFRGRNYYLSNMFNLPNWIETDLGILVPTSEHDYQAARFVSEEVQAIVAGTLDPELERHGVACKRVAYELIEQGAEQRPDWDTAKLGRMVISLNKKFDANPELTAQLIATGDEELYEGNTWDDNYWGVSPPGTRDGQNWLGRLLMQVREERNASLNR